MGKRGPKPEPTPLKLIKGNPGKRPINEDEPKYDPLNRDAKPPSYFNNWSKLEWRRLLPLLVDRKLLTEADYGSFEMLCYAYGMWRKCLHEMRGKKLTVTYPSGARQQIPEVGMARNFQADYIKLGAAFGLTPSDRGRLNVPTAPENEPKSPMQEAMERRRAR